MRSRLSATMYPITATTTTQHPPIQSASFLAIDEAKNLDNPATAFKEHIKGDNYYGCLYYHQRHSNSETKRHRHAD